MNDIDYRFIHNDFKINGFSINKNRMISKMASLTVCR